MSHAPYQRPARISLIIILLLAMLAILLFQRQPRNAAPPPAQPTTAPSKPTVAEAAVTPGADPFAELQQALDQSVEKQQWSQAGQLARDLLAQRELQQSPQHPHVSDTLVQLAEAQLGLGAYEDAERSLLRALDIRMNAFGEEDASLAEVWLGMSRSFHAREMFVDAVQAAREGIPLAEQKLPDTDRTGYYLRSQLALTLTVQKNYTGALPHMLKAANWLDKHGTLEERRATYERMTTFYAQTGDRANEALWRGKLKSLP